MNINNLSLWVYANGLSATRLTGRGKVQGAFFPRGTAGVIFQDGLIWGGKVHDGQEPLIRVGGTQYEVGHVAGSILLPGVAENHDEPQVARVWRIRRDYFSADLRQDAAGFFAKPPEAVTLSEIESVRQDYEQAWTTWPWQKGAPFYDAESDGVYTPAFNPDGSPKLFPEADEPGLADADQVVWLVVNDLFEPVLAAFSGSPPIGIEMQVTLWAYNRTDALGNVIFRRHRLIYKGTGDTPTAARIDSMYMTQWTDPDLGDLADDLVGCDTLLNLAFVYNSQTQDTDFERFSLPPPAVGYDLLAGALAPASFSEANFDLKKRQGFRNLPMNGFAFFAAGIEPAGPGPLGTYSVTLQWYNLMRGYRPRPESVPVPFFDPITGRRTRFMAPGDPVTGEGWVDEYPGDRHMHAASGPFTLSFGDTNEVTIGFMGALASDRLMSISLLKYISRFIQRRFDNLFEAPVPPPAPALSASEFDNEILLNWGQTQEKVERIEHSDHIGFRFEGYNVYQLPSADAGIADGVKLATFDLKNDVSVILQDEFDPQIGILVQTVVQSGSNSGVFRTLRVRRDSLHHEPLHNGQAYYFGVSAYSFNPDPQTVVRSLESVPTVVTVVPQSLQPGRRLHASFGDTVTVVHSAGRATGRVYVVVADPARVTGDTYQVVFGAGESEDADHAGTVFWHLVNLTTGDTLLKNQPIQSSDEKALITDGFHLNVLDSPPGISSNEFNEAAGMVEVSYSGAPLSAEEWDQAGAEFGGNTVWHDLNSAGFAERYYVSAGGGSGQLSRLTRNIAHAAPFDFELRFTTEAMGSLGWWAFTSGTTALVPFHLWRIGIDTPDDPTDDVQLIPLHFSDGTDDAWDLSVVDPALGCRHCSDWTYFYFDPRGYEAYREDADDGIIDDATWGSVEYFARMILCDVDDNGVVAPPGTVIRIHTTKPFTPQDIFTFSTAEFAPTFSEAQAREDVKKINVFPNPYYGILSFESRFPSGFVTFHHLPEVTTVRIFSIAGVLVRKLEKNDNSQFMRWDLKNESGRFVGGGIYVAHVEMPELGVLRSLKLLVVPN